MSQMQQKIELLRNATNRLEDYQPDIYNTAVKWFNFSLRYACLHPESGLAATICVGTDRYGATVVRADPSSGRIWVKRDLSHKHLHVINPDAKEEKFFWFRGKYVNQTKFLLVGVRETHWNQHL